MIDGGGKEARGTGNAARPSPPSCMPDGDHTRVTVDTDLKIVGKLAQFGSGMLQQVSEKLLGQFVESLEAKLAADTAPAERRRDNGAGADAGRDAAQPAAEPARSTSSSWRAAAR